MEPQSKSAYLVYSKANTPSLNQKMPPQVPPRKKISKCADDDDAPPFALAPPAFVVTPRPGDRDRTLVFVRLVPDDRMVGPRSLIN
jgi:hypothetical protein